MNREYLHSKADRSVVAESQTAAPFPKEVQERFASDPEFHKAFRARVERSLCVSSFPVQPSAPLTSRS